MYVDFVNMQENYCNMQQNCINVQHLYFDCMQYINVIQNVFKIQNFVILGKKPKNRPEEADGK